MIVMSSMLVAGSAAAAPGGEPGKPDAQPNAPQATQGNPGSEKGREVRAQPEPEPQGPRPQGNARPAPTGSHGNDGGGDSGDSQSRAKREAGTNGPNGSESNPQDRGPSAWTTYCHSTRSDTNPYVVITTNDNALPTAHRRHHDGDDIIPAENGECPGGTAPTTVTEDSRRRDGAIRGQRGDGPPSGSEEPGAPGEGQADEPGLNGVEGIGGRGAPRAGDGPDQGVLGESETSPGTADGGPGGTAPAIAEETGDEGGDGGGELPFTGLGIGALLALALLALAGGFATRRAADR